MHPDLHVGYCTNVAAAESGAEVLASLALFARARVLAGLETLGLGLYLSHRAAGEIDAAALRDALGDRGLHVFTLNGFPFGDFHAARVKEAVYAPDWTAAARVEHTLRLASLLEVIAPQSIAEPTISTVPLGRGLDQAGVDAAAHALVEVAHVLAARAERSGRAVRICLEPEPGCTLQTAADVVRFFDGPLARAADGSEAVRHHLGVCYDTCHQAVMHEDPHDVLQAFAQAGIAVGKAQLSSALVLDDPHDDAARAELAAFDEPRYLHQVRTRAAEGLAGRDDLPAALAELERAQPWRCHFHVPIHVERYARLGTTRADLEHAIAQLRLVRATTQLEVETYTWSVLPPAERPRDSETLAAGLASELRWVQARLGA